MSTNASTAPWSALPGTMTFTTGHRRDYLALQRYHYRQKPPATTALVRVARYTDVTGPRLVGVAMLSYPVPMLRARLRHFGIARIRYGAALRFANRGFLTVSRIVIHPQFRTLGLAVELVKQLVEAAPSRYVEASASMARYGHFLERAGLTRVPADDPDEPAYFILDKRPTEPPFTLEPESP
ncbi:MAG: GNAT family N-acetyltransferase [Tepidisphaeraceae bacterium]